MASKKRGRGGESPKPQLTILFASSIPHNTTGGALLGIQRTQAGEEEGTKSTKKVLLATHSLSCTSSDSWSSVIHLESSEGGIDIIV